MLLHTCLPMPMRLPLLLGVCSTINTVLYCTLKYLYDNFGSWELPCPWTFPLLWDPSSFWPSPLLLFSTQFLQMNGKMIRLKLPWKLERRKVEKSKVFPNTWISQVSLFANVHGIGPSALSIYLCSCQVNMICCHNCKELNSLNWVSHILSLGLASHVRSSTSYILGNFVHSVHEFNGSCQKIRNVSCRWLAGVFLLSLTAPAIPSAMGAKGQKRCLLITLTMRFISLQCNANLSLIILLAKRRSQKNDRRNSGGTLRQKFNLNDI